DKGRSLKRFEVFKVICSDYRFMKSDITKVTSHINPNEALIFERSQSGRVGYRLSPLDVDEQAISDLIPQQFLRDDDLEGVPEVSEVDVIRHFVRMSMWNFSIDQ